jgi:collagenase-like protein with putative collagen-binding domain
MVAATPGPELILAQPGQTLPSRTVVAARSDSGDLALIYTPEVGTLELNIADLRPGLAARWVNPSTGERFDAAYSGSANHALFASPAPGDWVLLIS